MHVKGLGGVVKGGEERGGNLGSGPYRDVFAVSSSPRREVCVQLGDGVVPRSQSLGIQARALSPETQCPMQR